MSHPPRECSSCGLRWNGPVTDACPSDRCPTNRPAPTDAADAVADAIVRMRVERSLELAAALRDLLGVVDGRAFMTPEQQRVVLVARALVRPLKR